MTRVLSNPDPPLQVGLQAVSDGPARPPGSRPVAPADREAVVRGGASAPPASPDLAQFSSPWYSPGMDAEPLRVTCAIIEREGLVLAARRSENGSMPGKWEFPGGKIERGETPEDCLRREIREELGREVRIRSALPPSLHRYARFAVLLHPFVCGLDSPDGSVALRNHSGAVWLRPEALPGLDWAEADIPVLRAYLHSLPGKIRTEGREGALPEGRPAGAQSGRPAEAPA